MSKQIIFLFIVLFISSSTIFSQPCNIGNGTLLSLTSQAQVNQFGNEFPSCTELERDLRISGDDITNLSSLSNITRISGYLRIDDCPNLISLNGLNNVEHIGNYLRIQKSEAITDLSALNQLEFVGGDFIIQNLPALVNTGNFANLDSLREDFSLGNMGALNENAFSGLVYANELELRDNTFASLSAFPNLSRIETNLDVDGNFNLIEINDFSQLTEIGEDLIIVDNVELNNIRGFENLNSVVNTFEIKESPALREMNQAFNSLQSAGYLFSIQMTDLVDLSMFENLTSTGPILIYENPNLINLSGLESVTTVDGEILIYGNGKLQSMDAMADLDYSQLYRRYGDSPIWNTGYVLYLGENTSLNVCNIPLVCDLLKHTEPNWIYLENNAAECDEKNELILECKSNHCYPGSLNVSAVDEVADLFADLPICNFIDGDLIIGANGALADNAFLQLGALEFIDTIAGDVIIENTLLRGVSGLNSIHFIGGELIVRNNPNLETFKIFQHATAFGGITIEDNPMLEDEITLRPWQMEGEILIKNNPLLEEVDLTVRGSFDGSISLEDNPSARIDFEATSEFQFSGDLRIINNEFVSFIIMQSIHGDLHLENNNYTSSGTINIDSIYGSLIVQNNPDIETFKLDYLTYIGGNFHLINNEKLTMFAPSGNADSAELRYIGGDLKIINNGLNDRELEAEFELLRTVGGELVISDNPILEALTAFNSLIYNTTTAIRITNNPLLVDCDLKTLCWHLSNNPSAVIVENNAGNCIDIQAAESNCDLDTCVVGSLGASTQAQIDRWLEINEICTIIDGNVGISDPNPAIDPFSLLGLSNIVEVTGDVRFHGNSLETVDGFDNLKTIGGGLEFSEISADFDMSALANLEAIGGTLESRLSNMKSYKGFEKLERIGSLRIGLEEHLESLEGLETLRRIDDELSLRFLELTHLNELENLNYIGRGLEIFCLSKLEDISALSNVRSNAMEYVEVFHNPLLTDCDYRFMCEFMFLNPDAPNIVRENGVGCEKEADIECNLFDINGTVFFDANENGVQDLDEFGIPNINLFYDEGKVLTNANGKYQIIYNVGEAFNIEIQDNPDWRLTTVNNIYTGVLDSLTSLEVYDFGLSPNFSEHKATLNVTSNNIRCSESGKFFIKVQNIGTFVESGEIRFNYDPNVIYESSDQEPLSHDNVNKVLTWSFDNLNPFQTIEIELQMLMPGLDFSGNTLNAKIEYWITEGTDDLLLTSFNYERTLGCAYDPNDKQIFPAGVSSEAYLLTAEPAVYTIRFQNTGNDFARDVTLVDNLPAEVDLESFNIVNTSHDVYTSIRDREVTFFFDDIYLIDSLTNAELSQGFVSFEVMFDQETPDFTVIENEAEIYFDFNPAIVTNTVRNTIVEMYPILSTDTPTEKPFVIYPNPTDHSVFFATQQRGNLVIYNLSMKQVAGHEIIESNTKLDLSQLTSGVYYLMFTTEDGEVFNEKLVKY